VRWWSRIAGSRARHLGDRLLLNAMQVGAERRPSRRFPVIPLEVKVLRVALRR